MGNLGRFRRRKRRPINYYRRGYDRVHFESLEPRLLLDSITADAEAAIIGGLESFKDWAATLDTYADMAKRLPLVNMGLSDIADVSEIAEEEIYNVVQDYFGSHAEPTTEELTAYLAGLSEYTGVVDSSDSSKYLFEVNFHGERTNTTQLDLTDQSALEYLDIDSPIDLSLTGSMDLSSNILADELQDFKNFVDISPDTVLSGLQSLPDLLTGITGVAALGKDLPVIGSSLTDAVGVLDQLQSLIDDLSTFTTAQGLKSSLESALNSIIPGSTVETTITENDIQFKFQLHSETTQPIEFHLQEELSGMELSVDGNVDLTASADASIRFGLSFDTGIPELDRFYLVEGDDSSVDLAFKVTTSTPFTASADLGLVSVGIENGTITVAGKTSGELDPSKDATVSIDLVDPGTGSSQDGKITLAEIQDSPADIISPPQFDAAMKAELEIVPPVASSTSVPVIMEWSDISDPSTFRATFDTSALNDLLENPQDLLSSDSISSFVADGLRHLGDWFDSFASGMNKAPFNTELPLINKSLADLLNLGELFPSLSNSLLSFLENPDASTQHFVDGIESSLNDLATSLGNTLVNLDTDRLFAGVLHAGDEAAASWLGYTPDADLMLFNLGFELDRLAVSGNAFGAKFEFPVSLNTKMKIDLTFGYNLTDGLAPEDAFFIRLNDFSTGIDINVSSSADFDLTMTPRVFLPWKK